MASSPISPWALFTIMITASAISMPAMEANAEIGRVNTLNTPGRTTAAPRKEAAKPAQANSAEEERQALLVIRFGRNHVYFERMLRQAVNTVERNRAGALYEVVSYVPAGNTRAKNIRLNTDADSNVLSVVQGLQELGVPASRIQTSSESSDELTNQEVRIFVD